MSPAARAAKAAALSRFVSQYDPEAPVLPDHFRDRFDAGVEVLVTMLPEQGAS